MPTEKRHKILKTLGIITIISLVLGIVFSRISRNTVGFDTDAKIALFLTILFLILHWVALLLLFFVAAISQPSVQEKIEANAAKARTINQMNIDMEYQQAIASKKLTDPWAIRYATSACPHCGHYKVRQATWDDKKLSVAFWGAASDKIGKSYICDNCKSVW